MTKPKRRIHAFKFGEKDTDHVAVVTQAANLQEVLTMKAAEPEVQISMTMRTFLEKFYGLWSEDSRTLAGILGYSTDSEWAEDMSYDDYIQYKVDSVSLLKGIDLPEQLPTSLVQRIERLQKQLDGKLNPVEEGSPQTGNVDIEKMGESSVDKTDVKNEDTQNLQELKAELAELQKAKAASEAEMREELELTKSLVADLKAQKEQKELDEMTELVKGYSFVKEDEREDVVKALLKVDPIVLATLEKARNAVNTVVEEEVGVDGESDDISESSVEKDISLTSEFLKNRTK